MIQKLFYFLIFFLLTFGASAQLKPVDKQYIKDAPWNKNPGFEQGKSNYSLYKDADQAIPENMTGGTSDLKIALNSTNPIDGNRDLIITKDGSASRRGNGLSFPVTIPAGMQGQMVEICFQYRTSSGYLDDQVIVYAYDVTNSSLASTEPAPMQLKAYAASTGSATHCSYLQAVSNSTSYRVGLHVSGTSDVDYNITIDNFTVGKVSTTNGAVNTPVKTFTPTGSLTTNVTYTGNWHRNGEFAEIEYYLTFSGATDAGVITLNMPSGLVIDTSKTFIYQYANLGKASTWSGSQDWEIFPAYYTTGSIILMKSDNVNIATSSFSKDPFSGESIANGWKIYAKIKVPIVGWQATGILGEDAAISNFYTRASGDAASASAGNPVIFPTKDFGNDGSYGVATGLYTTALAGQYKVYGYVTSANATITLNIAKDGVTDVSGGITDVNGEGSFVGIVNANANQTLSLEPSGTLDVDAGSWIAFERVSGPANAVALESDFKIPVGTVNEYTGTTAPTGWLLADGSSYERTGIYARLYGVIGTKYGAADSTHFNVPDMRGRFARGAVADATPGVTNDPDAASRTACATGGSTGATLGSCQADAFQGHYHTIAEQSSGSAGSYITRSGDNSGGGPYTFNAGTIVTDGVNGTPRTSSQTYPYNVSFTYIIKY